MAKMKIMLNGESLKVNISDIGNMPEWVSLKGYQTNTIDDSLWVLIADREPFKSFIASGVISIINDSPQETKTTRKRKGSV